MSAIKTCKCRQNNWQWQLGEGSTSWIRCQDCGDRMFGEDVGVILVNWKTTDTDFSVSDVLDANQRDGVVEKTDKRRKVCACLGPQDCGDDSCPIRKTYLAKKTEPEVGETR